MLDEEVLMTWLTGEPTLDDVLSDPVVHAMMARDHVDAEGLRDFLNDIRRARARTAIPSRRTGDGPRLGGQDRGDLASRTTRALP
jgi:hypothetical protein